MTQQDPNLEAAPVTAALSTNVNFNTQVQSADDALKARNAASRNVRAKWLVLMEAFTKHGISIPYRRGTPDTVMGYISSVRAYKPKKVSDDELAELEEARNLAAIVADNYSLKNLMRQDGNDEAREVIEAHFPGFKQWFENETDELRLAQKAYEKGAKGNRQVLDEKGTEQAKAALEALIKDYSEALEVLEDTADVLGGVKEYIGVVEQIANISAIANGGTKE